MKSKRVRDGVDQNGVFDLVEKLRADRPIADAIRRDEAADAREPTRRLTEQVHRLGGSSRALPNFCGIVRFFGQLEFVNAIRARRSRGSVAAGAEPIALREFFEVGFGDEIHTDLSAE